jgi:hypothetical protein
MALINPLGVYTGGNVVFNSNPYTAFATNMMQRKAARDEAMDNYYRDLNKSINPAGVRTQDINGFMQRTNALQDYWQKNRDAIKNPRLDNGASQTEYNSRYQDIQGYINSSKQAELQKKPFVDALSDPDKRERVSDRMLYDVHLHDLPLDDQNRKQFDITQEDFNPKQMTSDDWQKYYKGVGEGITPDKNDIIITPSPTDKFTNIETTVARYTPEKLQTIGNLAKTDYDSDHRLQYNFNQSHPFKDWKQEHEGEFNKYNSIYQQTYGQDIQDDRDLHSAIVLSKKIEPTSIAKTDDYGKNNGTQQGTGNAFDNVPNKKMAAGYIQDGKWFNDDGTPFNTNGGQSFIQKEDIPVTWISALKSGGVDMSKIKDGVYVTVDRGEVQSVYHPKIGTITRPMMEGVYQRKMDTEPQKAQRLQFGQQNTSQSENTQEGYSRSELLNSGKGWTNEKINAAVKAGKIKVHD